MSRFMIRAQLIALSMESITSRTFTPSPLMAPLKVKALAAS